MKFENQWLQDLVYDELDSNILAEIVEDTIVGTGRWTITHRIVFLFGNQFYTRTYNVGATEYQDEGPFEFEDDWVECPEVFEVQKTITVYEEKVDG